MVKKFASLLGVDASNYEKIIRILEKNGFDGLHFDVMDGHFVKNFAFSATIIKSLRKLTTLPFNIHMQVENPEVYIDMFIDTGSNIITIHPQTCRKLERELRYIKAKNVLCSLAIDPDMEVEHVQKYLPLLDNIVLMSVYPGLGEQRFIRSSLCKLAKLKEIILQSDFPISISIDGAVDSETSKMAIANGADVLIYGSSMFEMMKFK